jgi:hypothetical protein
MTTGRVKIGPEFFEKAKNDYDNWQWALVREYMQNGIDAKSKNIKIILKYNITEDLTTMEVVNDGEVMTDNILEDKLLCLGGSGKNFVDGSVGGFGKAKELLFFCHESYTIQSGCTVVTGKGADFTKTTSHEYVNGVATKITMKGPNTVAIADAVRKFASLAQWSGKLSLILESSYDQSCEELQCSQSKGTRRRELNFGTVYTSTNSSYELVVRIGGIPMFHQYSEHNRLVIIELNGKSNEVLTSSRDNLLWDYKAELNKLIAELAINKRSALSSGVKRYEYFEGTKLNHESFSTSESVLSSLVPENRDHARPTRTTRATSSEPDAGPEHLRTKPAVDLGHAFVLKNETDRKTPNYYNPASAEFSEYSQKLIKIWGKLMTEMHKQFKRRGPFSVGFVFGDCLAQYEDGAYGTVYYISPANDKFKKQWKLDNAGKKMLLAVAAHEFVHGLGYTYHDESFSSKYTEVVGVVLANAKKFNHCFK